jgi:ABC-2 type transport system permease protein/Cu-processing system permease protein
MQIAVYFVSLFALLAAVNSAQIDQTEWPVLFAQPVRRAVYFAAKLMAYLSIFLIALALLFLPGLIAGAPHIPLLYGETVCLAVTFLTLGLTVGFLNSDRAQALIVGVSIWLFLLFVVDLAGLFAARLALVQAHPDSWISLLMLDPLDAFRIHVLFALEQIPAEAANKTWLAGWWIEHAGQWYAALSLIWCAVLSAFAIRRLNRWEE